MRFFKFQKPVGWLFLFSFLIFFFYRILLILTIQTDLGGIENTIIYFIQRSLAGMSLYSDPEMPPFSINQYGPVYYLLLNFIGNVAGTKPDDVLSVFILNRTVSFSLNILYSALVYLIAKKIFSLDFGKSAAAAILSFIFIEITSFARVDSLNHFLFFLSFYFFLLWEKKASKETKYLILSAVTALVALYTKQSSFTIPIIVGLWLLLSGKNKALFTFTLTYIICFLLSLLLVHFKWGIPVFYKNVVEGLNNGINLGLFWGNIIKPFFASFGLLWIPLAALVHYHLKKQKDSYLRFAAFAMLLQFLISAVLSFKFGSHINYFTEFWTLLFLGCAFSWHYFTRIFEKNFASFPTLILSFILLLKITLVSFPFYETFRNNYRQGKEFFEKEKNLAATIEKNMTTPGKYVFTNLFSPHSFLNNLLYKKAIMPQYEIVYFTTYERKVFDYSGFKNIFKTGQVQFIITKSSVAKPVFMDFTIENYSFLKDIGGYRIYAFNETASK